MVLVFKSSDYSKLRTIMSVKYMVQFYNTEDTQWLFLTIINQITMESELFGRQTSSDFD